MTQDQPIADKRRPDTNSQSPSPTTHSGRYTHLCIAIYVIVTAVVPYQYGQQLLTLLVIALIVRLMTGRAFAPKAVGWSLALTALGIIGTLIGLSRGNLGAFPTTSIYVIEPLVLGLLFASVATDAAWPTRARRILDLALIATAAMGIALYMSTTIGFTIPSSLIDPNYTTVDTSLGTLRTNYQGYNSFVFLAAYGVWRSLSPKPASHWTIRVLLLAASLSGLILSGRRILYLVVPASLLITYVVSILSRKRAAKSARQISVATLLIPLLGLFGLAGLLRLINIQPLDAASKIMAQFTLGSETDKRTRQAGELLDAWSQHPLIGGGSGSTISGYVRNAESPWAFELSYHMTLMNFGLIGLLLLGAWGAWTARGLLQGIREGTTPVSGPILAGFVSTALSIYVDPYVHKLDGMWMLFIPFATAALILNRTMDPRKLDLHE